MAKSEPRKMLERADVEALRKIIWNGKSEVYKDGWKYYARRAFDKSVTVPEGKKEEFYEGLHDSRVFANALYARTAKLVTGAPAIPPEEMPKEKEPETEQKAGEPEMRKYGSTWVDNEMSRFLKGSGMTSAALADKMGITPSAVSSIVAGRNRMSKKTAKKLDSVAREWKQAKLV